MSPLKRRSLLTGGSIYPNPLVGPVNHTHAIAVNIAALTTAEVDARGYLKPGVIFAADGTLVGIAPDYAFGITVEPLKVATGNTAAELTAAGVVDVALATIGQVNRAVVEDILGRVLTADEIAGFTRAGSTLKLLQ